MQKPKRLHKGDTVALVSLSSGMAGDAAFSRRVEVARQRLEGEFGLSVRIMPYAMKGTAFLDAHPEARAADMMAAFADPTVQAVFSMIGGDDTIRLLPYIDFDVLAKNPKVFMGYSDTTVNHFMLQKAGVVSFYGPAVLEGFAENVRMHDDTVRYVRDVLFEGRAPLLITPSPAWTSETLDWADTGSDETARRMTPETRGHLLLQGRGTVRGRLLGGCIDVFQMLMGTPIWPAPQDWDGCILFLETSEDCPRPEDVQYLLRGMAAQGIFDRINGVIVGKPFGECYFDAYGAVLTRVIGREAGRPYMPVLQNLNFGHTAPMCVLPYGIAAEIDCDARAFRLLESGVL